MAGMDAFGSGSLMHTLDTFPSPIAPLLAGDPQTITLPRHSAPVVPPW